MHRLTLSSALLTALGSGVAAVVALHATRPLWMPVPMLLAYAIMGVALAADTRCADAQRQ